MITKLTRERFESFSKLVQGCDSSGRWLILTHDNPDPDSIAAAAALSKILRQAFKHPVTVAYGGIIGRAENREMVKVLGIRLSHVRHLNWRHYRHFALVDCQPQTGNNQLPADKIPDLIFDHHPVRRATRAARFTDIRTEYGATATILAEYLLASGIEFDKRTATALGYAIRSETQDFGREFSGPDKAVFDILFRQIDIRALARIQMPRLPISYFENLHQALENLTTVSTLIVSHLGTVDQPDIVPEVADLLLRLEGKTWSFCTGVFGDRLYLSIRTTNSRADAGKMIRRLLRKSGKGGGHGMLAGGWMDIEGKQGQEIQKAQELLAIRLAKFLKKNPQRFSPIEFSSERSSQTDPPRVD